MVLFGMIIGVVTVLGVAAGNILGGLDMDVANIAATSLLVSLLGIVFGGVALLLSAATGRVSIALWGAVGLALVSHMANAFLPFNESASGLERRTPNYSRCPAIRW